MSPLKEALELSDRAVLHAGVYIFERTLPPSEKDLHELIELRDRMEMHHRLLHEMTTRVRRDLGTDLRRSSIPE